MQTLSEVTFKHGIYCNIVSAELSTGVNGQNLTLRASNGGAFEGPGGAVSIQGGNASGTLGDNGGSITLSAGTGATGDGTGGNVIIEGGFGGGTNGNGGHVTLKAGTRAGSGLHGQLRFQRPGSFVNAIINLDSLSTSRTFTFPNVTGTLALTSDIPSNRITRSVNTTAGNVTMGSTASTDYVYFVAGAHTVSLPAAAGNTNRYTVKNLHSANITIDTAGSELVEGAASISIAPEESVDLISNGTNWYVI